jgi:GNAT superfamily N-acetyltransferase
MQKHEIRLARREDAEALVALINRAFLVERFFIDSDRISLPQVVEFLDSGTFLVTKDGAAGLSACVYVELRGDRGYLGLLSVDPAQQRRGLGTRLIAAAENYCRNAGCRVMDLQIVNLRQELPPYYRKLGYADTGTAPFPEDVPTKLPCHFLRMSKLLS